MANVRQHLIDPVSCIRCDGCRLSCANKAIAKLDGTLVIDFNLCDGNGACANACDTGAINMWRVVPEGAIYTPAEQAGWTTLPAQAPYEDTGAPGLEAPASKPVPHAPASASAPQIGAFRDSAPALAPVVVNQAVTPGTSTDIHHIVLDLSGTGMDVLEGQSVGILVPGVDSLGQPHSARLYSVASARDGENGESGHMALTIKRVVEDTEGNPHMGLCSNYICNAREGQTIELTGPFGTTFLLPNDPSARLLMICTGTGIAPMRGMIEQRRRTGTMGWDSLLLYYGGRTRAELPYLDDFTALADAGALHLGLALSREPGQAKTYVQDALLAEGERIASILEDPNGLVYICGLVTMEHGALAAMAEICGRSGRDWEPLHLAMLKEGRFHVETY